MSNILNFSKWSKLHEAEEAEMAATTSATGTMTAKQTLSELYKVLGKNDVDGFWDLSRQVGGIIKKISELGLDHNQRVTLANRVDTLLGGRTGQYAEAVKYFLEWSKRDNWESFVNLFSDEPGAAQGLTNDFENKFIMPKLASRQ
jgi:hypothetical protein